jgi:type IX secretion system PorP/SprF family membrane protein
LFSAASLIEISSKYCVIFSVLYVEPLNYFFINHNNPNKLLRLRLFALFIFIMCLLDVKAQDPHFSQFYASPLTLNPALTGLFAGEGRISSTYRNQWQSISNPFTTGTVAFDTRALRRVFKEQNVFGLGGMALYDQSNNGGLRSRYLAFTAGYNQQLDKYGHHRLGIGFQASFVSKTIDYTKFLFSRQFTPIGFDPTLPTGEPRSTLGINYPDMGTGILYSGISNTEQQWYIGASYYHITKPNESMTGGEAKLSPRTTIHAGYNFSVNEMSKLYFSGLYMNSAISSEVMLGSIYQQYLDFYEKKTSVLAGVYYRHNESIIPYAGIESGDFQIGLSYDINISSLRTASNSRGGFELSLQYVFAKDPSKNAVPKCYNKF